MRQVLDAVEKSHDVDLTTVSKLNGSEVHGPKRAHLVVDYLDDLSMNLMHKRDFYLFKYDFLDPANLCRWPILIWPVRPSRGLVGLLWSYKPADVNSAAMSTSGRGPIWPITSDAAIQPMRPQVSRSLPVASPYRKPVAN